MSTVTIGRWDVNCKRVYIATRILFAVYEVVAIYNASVLFVSKTVLNFSETVYNEMCNQLFKKEKGLERAAGF